MRLVITAADSGWHTADLLRAAGELGLPPVATVSFRTLSLSVSENADAVVSGRRLQLTGAEEPCDDDRVVIATSRSCPFDVVLVRTVPGGTLEQIVFRMDSLHAAHDLGVRVVNPPRCLETTIDKALTSYRLARSGLPTVPCISAEAFDDALEAFLSLGGDVVVKPLFGSEGKGVMRVATPEEAYRVFRVLQTCGSVYYLQPYIPDVVRDIRVLVLGGHELLAIERRHPDDWRHNIARGAHAQPYRTSEEERALAEAAAAVVGADFCGVDLLVSRSRGPQVLEVNGVPGWRAARRATGVDVARELLGYLVASCRAHQREVGGHRA